MRGIGVLIYTLRYIGPITFFCCVLTLQSLDKTKQKFQLGQFYFYIIRKVWYHQIWTQNYIGFIVSDLMKVHWSLLDRVFGCIRTSKCDFIGGLWDYLGRMREHMGIYNIWGNHWANIQVWFGFQLNYSFMPQKNFGVLSSSNYILLKCSKFKIPYYY